MASESLSWLIEEHGFEGYGRWWRILEIVSWRMESDNPEATYPTKVWARFLGQKEQKLKKFLESIGNQLKICWELSGNSEEILKISIPNLLKIKDEYSRKSGQTPDNVRTMSGAKNKKQNTEAEADKETPDVFHTSQAKPARENKARPDITELIDHLKDKMRIPALDGSQAINRRYAKLLIDKTRKMIAEDGADLEPLEAIKSIIDLAADDDFWGGKVTSVEKLYRHFVTLGQLRQKTPLVINATGGADNGFCS